MSFPEDLIKTFQTWMLVERSYSPLTVKIPRTLPRPLSPAQIQAFFAAIEIGTLYPQLDKNYICNLRISSVTPC
jgi:hypothetical protein